MTSPRGLRRRECGGFAVAERIAPPGGEGTRRGKPGGALAQPPQQGKFVAQIGQRREWRDQRRVARQFGDQPVAPRQAVAVEARRQHLDLHLRHVDAGRAFALARLAGNAQRHRIGDRVGRHRIGAELPGERQAQRVGAPARHVRLVARHAVRRAHHAGIEGAAGAVVVAHLDRAEHAAERPGMVRPVELRREVGNRRVAPVVAEQRAVIHARRTHDAARVQHVVRIERVLHGLERTHDARAEHRFVEFAARQAVAVFAAVRALVLAHERKAFLRHRAHGGDVLRVLHVQHRADVQAADRGMRIPRALGAVPFEHVVEPFGVVGKVLEIDGAVLDERHRLPVALHRHHDVEAGLAHRGDIGLERGVARAHHRVRIAEFAHQFFKFVELCRERRILVAVELHDEQRIRLADQHAVDRGAEDRDAAAEVDHGAIHQFHCLGIELHDVLRRLHRAAEGGELADAEQFSRLDRVQRKLDRGGEGERALRSHQQAREVLLAGKACHRRQYVDVVAADAPKLGGKARGNLLGFRGAQRAQPLDQIGDATRHMGADIVGQHAELVLRAIRQDRIDRAHVVGHQPVADRLRPAGVVARHAADRAARVRRGIDREEQPMLAQRRIEMTQHEAGFHQRGARLRIDIQDAAQVLRAVDHQRAVHRLAALAGAAAAGQHRDTLLARDRHGCGDIADLRRYDHTDGFDLVDRRVGGVAAAIGAAEQHLAAYLIP